jgi:cysteine desulfurase
MVANNESGALQPVAPVAQYCRSHNILFATDAAQAVGKVPVTISDLGDPDMIAIVGHKIGAPKGIACLYIRPGCLQTLTLDGVYPKGLLLGGGQEFGLRGGTENVPYIVGLGLAAANAAKNLARNRQTMETMRHRLRIRLVDALGDENVFVHGPEDPNYRLPNTLSVGFGGGINSASLLSALRERVAASAGATCHASGSGVSTVLTAMGIPEHIARSTIRLSLGPYTTADEIDRAASILAEEIWRQRSLGEFEKTEFSVRATRTLEGDSERFDLPL